jgi:bla regulator protein BlaR1
MSLISNRCRFFLLHIVGLSMTTQLCGMTVPPLALVAPSARLPVKGDASKADDLNFDVASIKPNVDPNGRFNLRFTPNGFSTRRCTLRTLIIFAFSLKDGRLIVNLPEGKEATYDIEAKVAEGDVSTYTQLTDLQKLAMLQRLLADRFQLKFHFIPKEVPVYALVVSNKGPKLTSAKPNADGKIEKTMQVTGTYTLTATGWTADDFFQFLSEVSGRYVVNRTGLTGTYDFTLSCAPDPSVDSRQDITFDGPVIFTALREQLGLALEPSTTMLNAIVIDHVEAPTPN